MIIYDNTDTRIAHHERMKQIRESVPVTHRIIIRKPKRVLGTLFAEEFARKQRMSMTWVRDKRGSILFAERNVK